MKINDNMKLFLTCDIGGTDLKYGIINESYEFLETNSTPTKAKEGGLAIINQIVSIFKEYSNRYQLKGIAISSAGIINPNTSVVLDATNTIKDFIGINIKEEINKVIDVPVTVENDVNCMALCEVNLGAGKGYENVVAMTIGTGIGGAIVKNGILQSGNAYSGGEWGNTIINNSTLAKYEDLASTRALVNFSKEIRPNIKNGLDVFKYVEKGDQEIVNVVNNFYNNLAIGITNIIYSINPDLIVLGGGITARGEDFLNELIEFIKPKMSPYIFNNTKFKIAKFKNNAGMIGAFINFNKRVK